MNLTHHMGGDHNRLCRSLFVTCHRMSQKCDWHNRLWYFHRLWSPKTWNHRNHILPNRFCCFFCVRLTQPRSLVTGYFNSNLAGVRNISLSPPVSSLHLANSCAIYSIPVAGSAAAAREKNRGMINRLCSFDRYLYAMTWGRRYKSWNLKNQWLFVHIINFTMWVRSLQRMWGSLDLGGDV